MQFYLLNLKQVELDVAPYDNKQTMFFFKKSLIAEPILSYYKTSYVVTLKSVFVIN